MSEIKVSVNVTLQGSVMLTQAETKQLDKNKVGTGYDLTKIKVKDDEGNAVVINVRTRKSKLAHQTINMYKEAYDYMTSRDSCLPNIKQSVWAKMKPVQRLEAHLDLMCKHLRGISYTYMVFND